MDAARIQLAQSQIQRAGKTALSSMLAYYHNGLKDQYGLFGLNLNNDLMLEVYEEYLGRNLNISGDQNFLYDFCIEKTNIEKTNNLENNKIFESQIMEFMKYRAPYELTADLLKKIEGIKNISGGAKVYKRKMDTDQYASEIGGMQLSLHETTRKINSSNISSQVNGLKNRYISLVKEYDTCNDQLLQLYELYSDENDKDSRIQIQKQISSVQDKLYAIENNKNQVKNTILSSVDQYKALNTSALEEAKTIVVKKDSLLSRIEEELGYSKEYTDGIKELQKSYSDSLSDIKNKIREDNSAAIITNLEANISKCDSVVTGASGNEDDFLSSIEKLSCTSIIEYKFNMAGPSESKDKDNRDDVIYALKQAFEEKGQLKSIDSSRLSQLPSRKKYGEDNSQTVNWKDFDFNDRTGTVSRLDYLAEKGSAMEQFAERAMEQLYINEYIMGVFRHDVPLLKGEKDSSAYNLRSKDKKDRVGYFSVFEVEYIINGNKDEGINAVLTKSEILSIRLMSNVIHIYTDQLKMSRITSLAAALSSWSAGLSTPLIQTMLVFSWAMLEALYDMDQLCKGERILLFKTKEQWMTDISGAVDKKKVTNVENNPLCLSYKDYLKIFLLMTDKDKKLSRIQDLVQLNIGVSDQEFLLENCKSVIKVSTTVSIRNLFYAIPSFSTEIRSGISRTSINDAIYMGY